MVQVRGVKRARRQGGERCLSGRGRKGLEEELEKKELDETERRERWSVKKKETR